VKIGMIGLGRMGASMVQRLLHKGHECVAALFARFASRGQADFSNRVLSAMRAEFGGHVEKTDK
jgi:6-phosphogluconate dehydrogenase (decarboxylating)